MKIYGINGAGDNMQTKLSGMNTQMDATSKNIQNQIANAQKKLENLSSDEKISVEEKMKKRQEIRQEITSLNQQLRQHQIERRKEKQQVETSMDDMIGSKQNNVKSDKPANGLSDASMQAIIVADFSMKQAKVQGNITTQMKGEASTLRTEIKMDKSRGGKVEKKEDRLAKLEERIGENTQAQISNLVDAKKAMEEAAKKDAEPETTETQNNNEDKTDKIEEANIDGVLNEN